MAKVNDFIEAQKKAKNSVETLGQRVRRAFDKALESTREGHYVRLDKLAEEANRKKFSEALNSALFDPLKKTQNALPEDPLFAEELAMHNFYGFGKTQISGLVDKLKEKLTFENFMQSVAQPLERMANFRLELPTSMLEGISTEDVLKYVGVKAKKKDLLTLQDKAGLINQFEQAGVVPPKYLKDKPYMK